MECSSITWAEAAVWIAMIIGVTAVFLRVGNYRLKQIRGRKE